MGQGQAQKFIESGENLTQERFTKSRQRKQRGPSRVVVPPFPNNSAYNRNLSLGNKKTEGATPNKTGSKILQQLSGADGNAKATRPGVHTVFKPAN